MLRVRVERLAPGAPPCGSPTRYPPRGTGEKLQTQTSGVSPSASERRNARRFARRRSHSASRSRPVEVELVQRRLTPVDRFRSLTRRARRRARAGRAGASRAAFVVPLVLLRELPAHEEELLARVRPHVARSSERRFASCCQRSPGIFRSSEPFRTRPRRARAAARSSPCTRRSSRTSTRCGGRAGTPGRRVKYPSVSCIQPMFHLNPKPSPPRYAGRETPGHESTPPPPRSRAGSRADGTTSFSSRRNEIDSRSSRPPYWFGIQLARRPR